MMVSADPDLQLYVWHMPKLTSVTVNGYPFLDSGINVADVPAPHRLAERDW